jgi:phosphocarrier protein FPr
MVGFVIVSHSYRLAEAAVELALQMVRGSPPPIEIASGLEGGVLGTDTARVREAIDRVATADGVLVLMDLGSAVLSAELALDLRDEADTSPVVLSEAPLVEGLVAAVVLAAAGATLDEVAGEARNAGQIKATLLGTGGPPADAGATGGAPSAAIEVVLHNPHGLHARPAARLVDLVRRFDADVTVRNAGTDGPGVSGRSLSALSTLGAVSGHHLEVVASGRQAREVLAAIAALAGRNFDEDVRPAPAPPPQGRPGPIGASPGIGVGAKLSLATRVVDGPASGPSSPGAERTRLLAALSLAHEQLAATRDRVARAAGEHDAAIFDAHMLLLEDEDLVGAALRSIDGEGLTADHAWSRAVDALVERFTALADPYLRARAEDVRGIGEQVRSHLLGVESALPDSACGVLVAAELTPSQAARLDPGRVTGLVTASGSPLSHSAILARALGIPAVVSAGEEILAVPDGTVLVVDGGSGTVVVDPPPDVLASFVDRAAAERSRAQVLVEAAPAPALTSDGLVVEVAANIASRDDALSAVRNGADAVGLLRTEFLFLDRRLPPDEEEQLAAYVAIADALGGRRLTIRTLDIGGDKPVAYLPRGTEANPFLGRRGIRLSLQHPELFKQQLRAIVRTGMQHPVTALFPMVTTAEELRAAKLLLAEAAAEAGCPLDELPVGFEVGVMVEVPAFALVARSVAPMVDLFSIGSNDLTQYTLAAERGNADVAHLADPLHPAVLRLIAEVVGAGGRSTRVALCGEMAADPSVAPLLVGLGVRELSTSPLSVPAVKHAIRSCSATDAHSLAVRALELHSADAVHELLAQRVATSS